MDRCLLLRSARAGEGWQASSRVDLSFAGGDVCARTRVSGAQEEEEEEEEEDDDDDDEDVFMEGVVMGLLG